MTSVEGAGKDPAALPIVLAERNLTGRAGSEKVPAET